MLYIEDNPSNIRLVEAILVQRPEVTLLVATQGGLGLELAREHRPALVLLDLNLPDISGEEVLRRLRGDDRTKDLRIVMLSADATPGQIERLRRTGADDYLTKPFEIDRFLAAIDDVSHVAGDGGDARGRCTRRTAAVARSCSKLRRLYPDGDELRGLVDLFLGDSPRRIEQLAAAARAGDLEQVWQAAHALRGSCSIVGAHRVEAVLCAHRGDGRAAASDRAATTSPRSARRTRTPPPRSLAK